MRELLCTAFVMFAFAGCVNMSGDRDALKTRAAFDLKCQTGAVQIVELAERAVGVRCGDQQATYLWDVQNQIWVMNSDGHPAGERSPGPPTK
jgi:hypothetical protein